MAARRPPPSAGGDSVDHSRVEMKDFHEMTKMGIRMDSQINGNADAR